MRLVQFDDEPAMRVIDVDTGKAREKTGVKASSSTPMLAFGDKLYLVASDNGYQVREYDLAKLGEPRVLLTNTDDKRQVRGSLARCGENRICLLESAGSDAKTTQVVAVDTKEGKLAWRKPAPDADHLIEMGDGVATKASESSVGALLFDNEGKQLLSEDAKKSYPVRVDASSVLLFSQISPYSSSTVVTGMDLAGKRTPLGSLDGVSVAYCSWSKEFITCPAKGEFRSWRFTG
jgi:hypothetical protein